jgi:SAM-dependent methyltransferase
MDRPDIEPGRFIGSLAGLRRVNLITGSARIMWPAIADFATRAPRRPIRILDVACGAGDTLARLDRSAKYSGIDLELTGCDIQPLAVDYARDYAARCGVTASFFTFDAVRDPVPADYDVVLSSLFLHHLDEAAAVSFLRRAGDATRGLLLIQDLVRSRAGYLLAAAGIPLLLCNDVCRKDGPASVEGAFSLAEARALAARAGLDGVRVEPRFPFRFLLRWEKP